MDEGWNTRLDGKVIIKNMKLCLRIYDVKWTHQKKCKQEKLKGLNEIWTEIFKNDIRRLFNFVYMYNSNNRLKNVLKSRRHKTKELMRELPNQRKYFKDETKWTMI